MRIRNLGIWPVVLGAFAFWGTGCEPYHHSRAGIEIDIHGKERHDDGDDHHDRDRHDHDDHEDDQ